MKTKRDYCNECHRAVHFAYVSHDEHSVFARCVECGTSYDLINDGYVLNEFCEEEKQLIPIKIRLGTPLTNYAGFLLPDAEHALYVADGCAFLIAVKPDGGHYVRVREIFVVSIAAEAGAEFIAKLHRRLTEVSAYELLTRHYDETYDVFTL